MKILMTSVFFYPHIGGIESVTEMLAKEFAGMEDVEVKVVTTTAEEGEQAFPFEVYRNPDRHTLWRLYRWCDVYIHQGISLKWVWPWLLRRKPWFIVYHQTGYQPGIKGRLKKWCSLMATGNIAVSDFVANCYHLRRCTTILNAYDATRFRQTNTEPRCDIAYVGKMWEDKGLHILLDAFRDFKDRTGSPYQLTLIGDGGHKSAEFEEIKRRIAIHPYRADIHVLGAKQTAEIAALLNRHKILAVPSVYMEAFGIVCLEGMGCGCMVIGSDGDGICEALHGHGFLFPKGDASALSQRLEQCAAMTDAEVRQRQREAAPWLRERTTASVARQYIETFKQHL